MFTLNKFDCLDGASTALAAAQIVAVDKFFLFTFPFPVFRRTEDMDN